MNRAEKRRSEYNYKKNKSWFDGLPIDKKDYIYNYITERVSKNNERYIDIFDKCVINAIDDVLDLDILKLENIMTNSGKYIEDYKNFLKNKGDILMKNEETNKKIMDRIKEYMDSDVLKADAIKLLKEEFDIPKVELSNLWLEYKSSGYKRSDSVMESASRKTKKKKTPKLELIRTVREIKGQYGTYVKGDSGIKVGDKYYSAKDIGEIEKYKKSEIEKYEKESSIIKNQIEKLKCKLEDLEFNVNIDMNKYDELLEVFKMKF